jgi:hypothetical protein
LAKFFEDHAPSAEFDVDIIVRFGASQLTPSTIKGALEEMGFTVHVYTDDDECYEVFKIRENDE